MYPEDGELGFVVLNIGKTTPIARWGRKRKVIERYRCGNSLIVRGCDTPALRGDHPSLVAADPSSVRCEENTVAIGGPHKIFNTLAVSRKPASIPPSKWNRKDVLNPRG